MVSLDLVVDSHKFLDTEFFSDHVQHTTFHSDASRGRRRVAVVKNWYRGRELGRGQFGAVFLEESERGEHRAVKDIAKNSRIDYKRELMAMTILTKHDALFVQFLGWYESDNYVHIAMEYIRHGHLRHYLKVERSESEAKAITRQLLEGLSIIHKKGFAHRDLKPENILVVSASPIWVKIADFGLAKLAGDGTAFRTEGGTRNYVAPEVGIDMNLETSEYTNAIDIWALGCITHEMLTQTLPFRGWGELSLYCSRPNLSRNTMLSKNISKRGIEFVERALAYPPEGRIAAKEALDLEWLRPEDNGEVGLETGEDWTSPTLAEGQGAISRLGIPALAPQPPPGWKRLEAEKDRIGMALRERPFASPGEIANGDSYSRPPTALHRFHPQPKEWPLTAQTIHPKPISLTAPVLVSGVIYRIWMLCVALAVNTYFPVVVVFIVWSLFFWKLVAPLVTAIDFPDI